MMATNNRKQMPIPAKKTVVKDAAAAYGRPILQNFIMKDDYSLVKKAREGIDTKIFYSLAEQIKMPEKTLASVINLSPRTISNYREQNKDLDANYSEHLLKIINLYHLGQEIFGSLDEFTFWLQRPFYNSTEKPMDLMKTVGGVDLIAQEVEKLAQGYPL
ncbi:hypothetical protein FIC_01432 [Flavobacteriaceae bacterium 3519-10]|nr:hypothetical protein FIC_01432 [Flavobacteriaceae bacterium 3519-10]